MPKLTPHAKALFDIIEANQRGAIGALAIWAALEERGVVPARPPRRRRARRVHNPPTRPQHGGGQRRLRHPPGARHRSG